MSLSQGVRDLTQQLLSFGFVGILATLVNAVSYHQIMLTGDFSSLMSNFFAFCLAFLVSLFGQFFWTFSEERRRFDRIGTALLRFLMVSLLGLVINSFLAFAVVDYMLLPHLYYIALMIFFTPIVLFTVNKLWVFKS